MELATLHQQVEAEKFCHYLLADDHDAWQIAQDYCDFLRETPGLADADTPRVLLLGYEIGSAVSHLRDTVIEEIAQPLEQQGVPAEKMERLCLEILEQLGLRELAFAHPAQLSGGQTRRMQVASFLAAAPEVIVACEPGAGLDPASESAVLKALRDYAASGNGVVLCLDYGETSPHESAPPGTERTAVAPGAIVTEWNDIQAERRAPQRRWWQFAKNTGDAREFSSQPLSITARAGAVCWLRGENGAGKTTLLRQLAGITPKTGKDIDVDTGTNAQAASNPKATVSLTLQDPTAQVLDASASEMLDDEGLWEIISPAPDTTASAAHGHGSGPETLNPDAHPLDLSPSQLRLLQVASVVAQRRQVVLLDEPDVGLTPADRRRLHQLLHNCLAAGGAVIMNCHDPSLLQDVATYAEVTEAKIARASA
ncbi:ATP-binding cassette domain-containing protein [Corynebacterium sp. MNWGS58]|uniref:ATP-binding cassette domain-containing protein n=1 Tax=Corynebacterium sp. 102791.4 TaxID=3104612 RepID=UPI003512D2A3